MIARDDAAVDHAVPVAVGVDAGDPGVQELLAPLSAHEEALPGETPILGDVDLAVDGRVAKDLVDDEPRVVLAHDVDLAVLAEGSAILAINPACVARRRRTGDSFVQIAKNYKLIFAWVQAAVRAVHLMHNEVATAERPRRWHPFIQDFFFRSFSVIDHHPVHQAVFGGDALFCSACQCHVRSWRARLCSPR